MIFVGIYLLWGSDTTSACIMALEDVTFSCKTPRVFSFQIQKFSRGPSRLSFEYRPLVMASRTQKECAHECRNYLSCWHVKETHAYPFSHIRAITFSTRKVISLRIESSFGELLSALCLWLSLHLWVCFHLFLLTCVLDRNVCSAYLTLVWGLTFLHSSGCSRLLFCYNLMAS